MMKIWIIAVVLFVCSTSLSWSAEWTKVEQPFDSSYLSIFRWETCSVLVPKNGGGVYVSAYQKWDSGYAKSQFAKISNGLMVQSSTTRYAVSDLGSHDDDRHVFYRVCMPAAKDLPSDVKNLFDGHFGL